MTEDQFRHALHAGLGRAILLAQSHDVSAFRTIILDACLYFRGCDGQIEGTRAGFMYELVSKLPNPIFFRDQILNSLTDSDDNQDAVQRFRLAANFAFDGDDLARKTIYETFEPGPNHGEEIAVSFLQLDGLDGLRFVAGKVGTLIAEGRPVDEGLLRFHAGEQFGENETTDFLRREAKGNPNIAAYFDASEKNAKRRSVNRPPDLAGLSFEEALATCGEKPYLLTRWAKTARDQDLAKAAQDLAAATDPALQRRLLFIFVDRSYPINHSTLMALAHSENRKVRFLALRALSKLEHPAVRKFAFDLIHSGDEDRQWAIAMLDRNFQPGDHVVALNYVYREHDTYVLHRQTSDLVAFWRNHPEQESETDMLMQLYEKNLCSFCRECAVRRLIEMNSLPNQLRTECAFDANDDIRELVAKSG